MHRIIDETLVKWKQRASRKPMLIDGAPRSGKTYAALELGKKAYCGNFINIDLSVSEVNRKQFLESENLGGFLGVVEKIHGAKIDFEKTLVIIDNIDRCPRLLKEVRDLCEQRTNLNIVLIGMISKEKLKDSPWINSGYERHRIYPLCFVEFLRASHREDLALLVLSMKDSGTGSFHRQILEELEDYLKVGGMPEVVKSWVAEGDLVKVRTLQHQIIEGLFDLQTAGLPDRKIRESVLQGVATNFGCQLDYQMIAPNSAMSQVKHCLDTLEACGIVHRVNPSNPNSIHEVNFKVKKFKVIFADVGLLQAMLETVQKPESQDVQGTQIFEVQFFDQFTGQELLFTQDDSVKYWASSVKESSAVVNFLVPSETVCHGIPIIIRSHDIAAQEYSLKMCLGSYPECKHAYILSKDPYTESKNEKVKKVPIYNVMALGSGVQ